MVESSKNIAIKNYINAFTILSFGKKIYIADGTPLISEEKKWNVFVYNMKTKQIKPYLMITFAPTSMGISPDGSRLFFCGSAIDTVATFDIPTNVSITYNNGQLLNRKYTTSRYMGPPPYTPNGVWHPRPTIPYDYLRLRPRHLGVTQGNMYVIDKYNFFVGNGKDYCIAKVTLADNHMTVYDWTQENTVYVPSGIATDGKYLYCPDNSKNTVIRAVINSNSNPVPGPTLNIVGTKLNKPTDIACKGNELYIVDADGIKIYVIDGTTLNYKSTIKTNTKALAITYNKTNNKFYFSRKNITNPYTEDFDIISEL